MIHCSKRKREEIKEAERRQYFISKAKAGSSKPQSPFVAAAPIPLVAVKPQKRDSPKIQYEDEQNKEIVQQIDVMATAEMQSSPVRKKKRSHKHRKHKDDLEDDPHTNEGCAEQIEAHNNSYPMNETESDQDRQPTKQRKSKKKQHRRKDDSPSQQEEEYDDSCRDENVAGTIESDISSRLPPPRKLPPLRENADNNNDDGH